MIRHYRRFRRWKIFKFIKLWSRHRFERIISFRLILLFQLQFIVFEAAQDRRYFWWFWSILACYYGWLASQGMRPRRKGIASRVSTDSLTFRQDWVIWIDGGEVTRLDKNLSVYARSLRASFNTRPRNARRHYLSWRVSPSTSPLTR